MICKGSVIDLHHRFRLSCMACFWVASPSARCITLEDMLAKKARSDELGRVEPAVNINDVED